MGKRRIKTSTAFFTYEKKEDRDLKNLEEIIMNIIKTSINKQN